MGSPPNQFYEQPFKHNSAKGGGGTQQGGHSLKLSCLVCPNKHMTLKGRPTQYLGACQFFQDQNNFKKKELMKSHKVCFICLNPLSTCRKPDDPKVCCKQSAWSLKCKHCTSTSHHSLICQNKPHQSYQNETQNSNHRGGGRGGGRGGNGNGNGNGMGMEWKWNGMEWNGMEM